jgi:putative DNA methylase
MVKKLKTVVAAQHTPPYKIHRYFARRPWNVFNEIIRTYSSDGDIVLDPFMGGGVTIYEGATLGRKVIGYDLNPLSKFIVEAMLESSLCLEDMENAYKQINEFINKIKFEIEGAAEILWSELTFLVKCNHCGNDSVLSNDQKISSGKYKCKNNKCIAYDDKTTPLQPKDCERLDRIYLYAVVKDASGQVKKVDYSPKMLSQLDKYIEKLESELIVKKISIPRDLIPMKWDRQLEDQLAKKNIHSFQDLFTRKNLLINLLLLDFIKNLKIDENLKKIMRLTFSASIRETNIMAFTNDGWQGGKPTTWAKHAYWIPSQFCEVDIQSSFRRAYDRVKSCIVFNKEKGLQVTKAAGFNDITKNANILLTNGSIEEFPLPSESIDAIVTDPPYGSNVQYLELSHFWHVWNKDLYDYKAPNFSKEAVSNRKKNFEGAKSMTDYEVNLHKVFLPAYKALKPNKTMTLTFNNKDMGAWMALLLSIFRCGFSLDKTNIVFQDGVENYQQTAHTKYEGSPYGDFIYTFTKSENKNEQLPIVLDELIAKIDSIFLSSAKAVEKEERAELKLSMFIDSIDSINRYAKNSFSLRERESLYNHFGKNYLKKIYG